MVADPISFASVFTALPGFMQVADPNVYQSLVYGRKDQTKYVLVIKNFEDEEHIKDALRVLHNNKNILIANLRHTERKRISNPRIKEREESKSPMIKIENFINFEFNDMRQLAELLAIIEKHLS